MNKFEWRNISSSFLTGRNIHLLKLVFPVILLLVSGSLLAQTTRISLKANQKTLKEVLKTIEQKSEYTFFYKDADCDVNKKISINVENEPISAILKKILPGSKWVVENKKIILMPAQENKQKVQENGKLQTIKGTITDNNGEALIGVNVTVQGTTIGMISDIDGNFSLDVPVGKSLLFSYVGYMPQTVKIGNNKIINVTMQEDSKTLEEIVIVGYGTQKKVNLTGAISSIDSKVLESRPLTNLGQGLQGLIPNLQITNNGGGRPGSTSSYNVRGYTSLSGGGPLVLVDGVQMDPNQINPSDVESVTVLKDASSAAIYGGRAAYGVVLITTKKGKKNAPMRFNYSYDYSITRPTRLPDLVNSLQFVDMYRAAAESGRLSGGPAGSETYTDLDIEKIKNYMANPTLENAVYVDPNNPNQYRYCGNTNWTKEMYPGTAPQQQHNLSINGGTEKTTYMASFSAFKQNGLMPDYIKQEFKRYNATLNLDTEVTSWLEINMKMSLNRKEDDQPIKLWGTNTIDTFSDDLKPMQPVYFPDGHFSGQGGNSNPLAIATLGGRSTYNSDDIWMTGGFTLRPFKGLSIVGDYTWNSYRYNSKFNQKEFDQYGAPAAGADITDPEQANATGKYPYTSPASVSESSSHDVYQATNIYAQYENTLAQKHYVKGMVGFNQESKRNESFSAGVKNLVNQDYPYIRLNNDDKPSVSSSIGDWALIGVFFRLNYVYDQKYLIEFNGRYDGSSRFARDNRYVFSPSVSVGYRISEEKFFQPLRSVIDNLKIRLSYGQLPNQQLNSNYGNYPYLATMGYGKTSYLFGNESQLFVNAPGLVSPNFTWEKVQTKNIGFDFTLLRNRLSGSFDYYIRDTKDMIVGGFKLPAILGTGSPNRNAADLRTKGFEFEVSWNDRIGKDFTYRVGFNLSDSQAKITKYDLNPDGNIGDHYVGEKIGEIWGFVTDGFYSTDEEAAGVDNSDIWGGKWLAGDVRYKNLNGDKTADGKDIISKGHSKLQDPGDRKIIGNNTARYNYGISLSAEYKNFDFSCLMQGVGKRDLMLGGAYFWGFTDEWRTPTTEQLDYWTPDNPNAYYPRQRFGGGGNFQSQTKYLQNGAYMRMKQLTLGYSIPKALLSKVRISSLRFYFTGQNLFEFTKMIKSYDPEQPDRKGDYPLDRAFSFGVQVSL